MWVMVYGWSKCPSLEDAVSRLAESKSVVVMMMASGNYVYVHGMVKDATELATFVSYVQSAACLQDAQVGIVHTPPPAPANAISSIDLRLIAALEKNSRKPISQIATEIEVTAKTARRRLNRMLKEGLIQFSINWQPDTLGDTVTNLHLAMRGGAEKEKVAVLLVKRLAANVVRTFSFGNLPSQIIVTLWTKNVRDMQRICLELEESGLFSSVVPNIIRGVRYYDEHQARAFGGTLKPSRRPLKGHDSG
jgi:DNA-binding Lrp family transcriptional regulator